MADSARPAVPERDTSPGDGLVQVAYLHPHRVSHSWHESWMRMTWYDAVGSGRITGTKGPFMVRCDSAGVPAGRNLAVRRFLDETEHEWLWFIDTDMGFLPDTVDRLVAAADPAHRPVVGALCFGWREIGFDGYGGCHAIPVPTLFGLAKDPQGQPGFGVMWEYPSDQLVRVAGTGAACLLIHRSVLAQMRAVDGDHWFDQVRYPDGRQISEDLSFCFRCAVLQAPVWVDTRVKTTHHKQLWVGEDTYQRLGADIARSMDSQTWDTPLTPVDVAEQTPVDGLDLSDLPRMGWSG